MDTRKFSVISAGEPATVLVDARELRLETETGHRTLAWSEVQRASRRDERRLVLLLAKASPIQMAFASEGEREEFVYLANGAMTGLPALDAAPPLTARVGEVPLLTLPSIPGRDVTGIGGMVTAYSVMSRDFISDFGSDLKSVVGGSLKGMERAMGAAIAAVRRDLSAEALKLGCDHIIGVTVSVAGVGDKAQAIVLAGTAVQTVSRDD